ncbi:hypothetical protein AB6A40_003947 [Gnathostoma spinigerum]|uniref:Mothers against decapentaplegic homolog n=1 Tax=Gnathostoma spinigerum TaxID=75299 RepID=A0ABD6EB74_9BILA
MMNNLFQFHGPAVKKLLGWKQGDEEEKWAEKAVDSLVKKLKKKKSGQGTVEDLEFALANPRSHSRCVTIPRSLDGRLQVSHRKGLPHVIYCRVWRWPDLQSHHELKPVPECQYPYDIKHPYICINPYHYQRIEPQVIPHFIAPAAQSPSISHAEVSPSMSSLYGSPPDSELSSAMSTSSFDYPNFMDSPPSYGAGSPSLFSEDGCEPMTSEMDTSYIISEPNFWCSLGYYELNSRVGQLFKVSNSSVVVDGFTDPSGSKDRICLGPLTNVNRNSTIEKTRKYIGRGVRFSFDPSSRDVTVTNLSDAPVFVQSRNSNYKLNLSPTTVCRIPPGGTMCIFYYQIFAQMLQRAQLEGYNDVYELTKMCFIRISFVKGWGADYQRQDVTSTPCWMEMQLHGPLACIDTVMADLEPPPAFLVTSFS